MKRLIAMMMALCLLLTLLPMQSFAAETESAQKSEYANISYDSVKNSAYYPKIRIEEAEAEPEEATEESGELGETAPTYNAPTYLTPEKAAVQLRKYMKNRTETFDLYVKYDSSDFNALADVLMEQAVAHTGVPTEGDYLLWHCGGWGGDVERTSTSQGWNFHYTVEMSYYTTAAQEKELTTAINSLLKTLNVSKKSDYEKVKAVYGYITENIVYDYATLEDPNYLLKHTAYAALVDKTAVCQGYASLLYRLMLELGVDCRVIAGEVITGEVNGEYTFGAHGWNIVKLGDVYYNLDATMDSELDPDLFFLRNSVIGLTHYRYLDYCSTQFHRDYPMSETDYVDGVAGQPEYVFALGTCGDDAYWAIDRDGKLTITGTGATYDYSGSGYNLNSAAPWTYWKDGFDTVIVEEGITDLGDELFVSDSGLKNVVRVTLPESLVTIGSRTFRHCENLAEIRIPDNVKTIERSAFYSCDGLQTVTLGNSLEEIDSYAFGECTALTGIQLPESLKSLGGTAFQNCDALKEITIPASVAVANGFGGCDSLETAYIYSSEIGHYAFEHCEKLHTVVLSDNLTQIISTAFQRCTSLAEITIPKSVTWLGNAFDNCISLKTIRFEGDAPQFDKRAFEGVEGTAYYPECNPTWTEEVRQNYDGIITWVPYESHDYEAVVTPATCVAGGYTTHTCIHCGEFYVDEETSVVAHTWSEGSCDAPRTCTVCGESSGKDGHIYDDGVDGICNICGIDRVTTKKRQVHHMLRMYNPNTGEHFYTGSEEERDMLVTAGWNYEGVAFTFPANTGAPVHRLFQPSTGEHLYTMDEAEKNALLAAGWNYEGVAFNSAYDTEAVQHRLYNPNTTVGAYHFTFSLEERDNLIAAGWWYQGIGWYSCWK